MLWKPIDFWKKTTGRGWRGIFLLRASLTLGSDVPGKRGGANFAAQTVAIVACGGDYLIVENKIRKKNFSGRNFLV